MLKPTVLDSLRKLIDVLKINCVISVVLANNLNAQLRRFCKSITLPVAVSLVT